MTASIQPSRTLGRYTLSADSRPAAGGLHTPTLSIRSGRGPATHDRVYRFVPLFPTAQAASRYAMAQGLDYLRLGAWPA